MPELGLQLFNAASKGNDNEVTRLLRTRADVHWRSDTGFTSLCVAAQHGHSAVVRQLLAAGANINGANNGGWTPVNLASKMGHEAVVQILASAGADLDQENENKYTPINSASDDGHAAVVHVLIAAGADINKANKLTAQGGWTPLNTACNKEHKAIIRALINAGADVNRANNNGWTPLNTASNKGYEAIVLTLIAAGANLNQSNDGGFTPLNSAADEGHTSVVWALIGAGADVNQPNNNGWTPLNTASNKGHAAVVEALIDAGADINKTNTVSLCGSSSGVKFAIQGEWTPLNSAADEGHLSIVKALIAGGANINQTNEGGWSPLNSASKKGHQLVVEALIAAGADLNRGNKVGYTPLNTASDDGHTEVALTLIAAGADLNQANTSGWTALNNASNRAHLGIVQALIAAGADINQPNENGWTPLNTASNKGHAIVVQALIDGGADLDRPNQGGWTPVNSAAGEGFLPVVQALIAAGADFHQANGLVEAVARGNESRIRELIAQGASPNAINKDGEAPLHVAVSTEAPTSGGLFGRFSARKESIDIVKLLLHAGAAANRRQKYGNTALHNAASRGHETVVRQLVVAGASVKHRNKLGETPRDMAIMNGHTAIAAILDRLRRESASSAPTFDEQMPPVARRSSTATKVTPDLGNLTKCMNQDEPTPWRAPVPAAVASTKATAVVPNPCQLFEAVTAGDAARTKALLAEGVNPNATNNFSLQAKKAQDDDEGETPLHVAVRCDQRRVLELLLRANGIDATIRNKVASASCGCMLMCDGDTPLIAAIKLRHRRFAQQIYTASTEPSHELDKAQVAATDIIVDREIALGRGGFGAVYKGVFDNKTVAVKTVFDPSGADALIYEMEAMQLCKSPYLLQLLAVSGQHTTSPQLVLEYMDGGDLRGYLSKKSKGEPVPVEYTTLEVAWVIANALADLHHNGLLHRDLKSHNVLLSSTNYIKLADLGLARTYASKMTLGTGTLLWTAPEVLTHDGSYDYAADIYSFGVILTELSTLKVPFEGMSLSQWAIVDEVRKGTLRPEIGDDCPEWLRELANDCMAQDPTQRPSAQKILMILDRQRRAEDTTSPPVAVEASSPATASAAPTSSNGSNGSSTSNTVRCLLTCCPLTSKHF
ncbi:serine/threonine-protein phosphatase 6 regulatory ankyrin repeat subunit C-like [Achlya hypogyna]|uniref:Serine/threonine-protein phosphatase 6 regulatory ankyrin repeat subunit C-like n=1 Tax=Achlya hypogyna TaxID=1202772 RepID=A0A1V9Y4I3_ACHHY|nr:serine/threonine-protein phosphatase 6 regulatory ankyrin repeat subunit C-like [Achlya hypogyna]